MRGKGLCLFGEEDIAGKGPGVGRSGFRTLMFSAAKSSMFKELERNPGREDREDLGTAGRSRKKIVYFERVGEFDEGVKERRILGIGDEYEYEFVRLNSCSKS